MTAKSNMSSAAQIGAHLSVAGGLHLALDEAVRLGFDCVQLFVKNQRQWKAAPLSDEQVRLFREARKRTSVGPVTAHASYLINLAAPDPVNLAKSIDAMTDELTRCEALGVELLVVHPGAHLGEGLDTGIARISQSIDEIHVRTRGFKTRIGLEDTAGQGSTIGRELSELGRIIDGVKSPERLAVCLDTCHLFAAGYDLRDAAGYERMIAEADRAFGLPRVQCIHTNDSIMDLGSRRDRHEHIGLGKLGRRGFELILRDPRLAHAPRILETEHGEDEKGREWLAMDQAAVRRIARQ